MKKLFKLDRFSSDSRTFNSFRNVGVGFASQGITYLFGVVNRVVFVRCLTAEYLGVNGLFTNVLSMLSLAELGIGSAIIFALYKPLSKKNEREVSALMSFYSKAYRAIGLFVAVIGLALLPFMGKIIGEVPDIKENLNVIYLLYLFNTSSSYFFSYKCSLLNADQKNYIVTVASTCTTVLQSVFQWIILLTTKNFIVYLICQSAFNLLSNIIVSIYVDKHYKYLKLYKKEKLEPNVKKSLFVNVKALVITKVSGILVNSTDNIIITALNGLGTTGLNSNYVLLTNTLNSILTIIFTGMTGSVGNANATLDKEHQMKLFNSINLLNFWLYGWCSIAFIILSNDIVEMFFGKEYVLSMSIVIIMAVNFYTVGMQNAVWTFYNTLGLFDHGKYLGLVTGAINIVLSIYLGKIWGLFGILFATFISRLLTNIWYSPFALFKYGFTSNIKKYFFKYIFYLVVLIFTLFLNYVATNFEIENGILSLILKLVICIIVPNLVFFIIFFKTKEFSYIKSKIKFLIGR